MSYEQAAEIAKMVEIKQKENYENEKKLTLFFKELHLACLHGQ